MGLIALIWSSFDTILRIAFFYPRSKPKSLERVVSLDEFFVSCYLAIGLSMQISPYGILPLFAILFISRAHKTVYLALNIYCRICIGYFFGISCDFFSVHHDCVDEPRIFSTIIFFFISIMN